MEPSKQIQILNALLRQIYNKRKEKENNRNINANNENVVEMLEKHNKNSEYFYFEVYLLEKILRPNGMALHNMLPNVSPQEIYLGCLKGENIYLQYKDFLLYQNKYIDLLKMVTPNLNKSIWYLETDLIENRLLKVFCKMNLINMKRMLKNCSIPEVCFCPSTYKVNDPESFVKIVNDIKHKKVLDFIPYIREYSIRNKTINNTSVYYLYDNIRLINAKCMT